MESEERTQGSDVRLANLFGLDFTPLQQSRYDLVIPKIFFWPAIRV